VGLPIRDRRHCRQAPYAERAARPDRRGHSGLLADAAERPNLEAERAKEIQDAADAQERAAQQQQKPSTLLLAPNGITNTQSPTPLASLQMQKERLGNLDKTSVEFWQTLTR
jgi:hypothetical protein